MPSWVDEKYTKREVGWIRIDGEWRPTVVLDGIPVQVTVDPRIGVGPLAEAWGPRVAEPAVQPQELDERVEGIASCLGHIVFQHGGTAELAGALQKWLRDHLDAPDGVTSPTARQRAAQRFIVEQMPIIRAAARTLGYAIAIHGTLDRDVDLVAIPWTADAADAEALAAAVRDAMGGAFATTTDGRVQTEACNRPHGRRTWAIGSARLWGSYVDLSVMPRESPVTSAAHARTLAVLRDARQAIVAMKVSTHLGRPERRHLLERIDAELADDPAAKADALCRCGHSRFGHDQHGACQRDNPSGTHRCECRSFVLASDAQHPWTTPLLLAQAATMSEYADENSALREALTATVAELSEWSKDCEDPESNERAGAVFRQAERALAFVAPDRPHRLTWNGTEWVAPCGCRYHPDDDNGSHGGAPHVHRCEKHVRAAPEYIPSESEIRSHERTLADSANRPPDGTAPERAAIDASRPAWNERPKATDRKCRRCGVECHLIGNFRCDTDRELEAPFCLECFKAHGSTYPDEDATRPPDGMPGEPVSARAHEKTVTEICEGLGKSNPRWLAAPPAVPGEDGRLGVQPPIPMLLTCPQHNCGVRHIDRGEFATKPHHTHTCQRCGHTWRPAKVHTVGVDFLPGYHDDDQRENDLRAELGKFCAMLENPDWQRTDGDHASPETHIAEQLRRILDGDGAPTREEPRR